MPALYTVLGILLILISIPFGLMFAPITLGVLFVYFGWKHLSAGWQAETTGSPA